MAETAQSIGQENQMTAEELTQLGSIYHRNGNIAYGGAGIRIHSRQ